MTDSKVRCFRNSEEIGEYIGESSRIISKLVLDENLPAWKRKSSGPWRALDVDLDLWLIGQRKKYLPRRMDDAQFDQ